MRCNATPAASAAQVIQNEDQPFIRYRRRVPSESGAPSTHRPGATICNAAWKPNQPAKIANDCGVGGRTCAANVCTAPQSVGMKSAPSYRVTQIQKYSTSEGSRI